jgi:DNA-binding transcriptional ArsR family regulator
MKIDFSEMEKGSLAAEAFIKQLANRNRLMILCVLIDGEVSVGELNAKVPITQSALSQHLAKLREAGFVTTRRESQTIYYKLADPRVEKIMVQLYGLFC